jgi:cytochrome c556
MTRDSVIQRHQHRLAVIAFIFPLLLFSAGPATPLAHSGAKGIVKERMTLMKSIGDAMKTLTAMFKGDVEYDAQAVRAAAEAINARGGDHMTHLFPDGSLQKPTEALPRIWEDWETFKQYAADLETYSAVLEAAADNEPGPMHGGGMQPGGHMMGRGPMMGGQGAGAMMGDQGQSAEHPINNPEALKQMPPMASFMRLSQTCNACHTKFRLKK